MSTYLYWTIASSLANILEVDFSNIPIEEEILEQIINAYRFCGNEYGLRIIKRDNLKYIVYWDKIHSEHYSVDEIGISRFKLILKYKDSEKAGVEYERLLR